jgi:flavin-dependent dehydrogenase
MDSQDAAHFIIIGGGVAGSVAFYYLSQIAPTLLIDEKPELKEYFVSRIFSEHNFNWMPNIDSIQNKIFPRNHIKSIYASKKEEVVLDSQEFGKPMGKLMNEFEFVKYFQEKALEQGGCIKRGLKIEKVEISDEEVIVSGTQRIFRGKMLLIATGSNFNLQIQLGFAKPDTVNWVAATFFATPEIIENKVPNYVYRLHPQMSLDGPLAINQGDRFFNIGLISSEPIPVLKEKFIRILHNYEPIQSYFKEMEPNHKEITESDLNTGIGVKHPIKNKVKDRVLLLGDAAGLVSPMYYEGIIGCLASARIAFEVLKMLYTSKSKYSNNELKAYEINLNQRLLDKYFASGNGSEAIFMKNGEDNQIIWESYIKVLQKQKHAREKVYNAYICNDLGNYPLKNDEIVGEAIFNELPLGRKITLMPIFLKAKLNVGKI